MDATKTILMERHVRFPSVGIAVDPLLCDPTGFLQVPEKIKPSHRGYYAIFATC